MDQQTHEKGRALGRSFLVRGTRPYLTADMRELLELFQAHGVEYVLVGGFAVNYYGYVRTTQDIDILILPSAENAERVTAALDAFGFGGAGIPRRLFEREGSAVHLGVEPNRIDLLTRLVGVSLDEVFARRNTVALDNIQVNIISLQMLIKTKQASDRARDRADAEELSKINDSM